MEAGEAAAVEQRGALAEPTLRAGGGDRVPDEDLALRPGEAGDGVTLGHASFMHAEGRSDAGEPESDEAPTRPPAAGSGGGGGSGGTGGGLAGLVGAGRSGVGIRGPARARD